MVGLIIIMFITLAINKVIASMNQTRTYNQVVDQIEASSQVTIKYLVNNYRVLTENLKKSNHFIVSDLSFLKDTFCRNPLCCLKNLLCSS